ncbi:Uncharacterised protein r2_g4120 [Pycnogonum litorale]
MPGGYKAPESFDFAEPERWPVWKQRFLRFRTATKLDKESDAVQVSSLLYSMGQAAEDIFESFTWPAEMSAETAKFDVCLSLFDSYFVPRRNIVHERAKFHARTQGEGESAERYIRALYEMSAHCEFSDKDEAIRDRIVSGIRDKDLSERLQLKFDLTLSEAVEAVRCTEMVKSQVTGQVELHAVSKNAVGTRKKQRRPTSAAQESFHCDKCDYKHVRGKCPAYNKTCYLCKLRGHFKSRCRNAKKSASEVSSQDSDPLVEFYVDTVFDKDVDYVPVWRTNALVHGSIVNFKIDSGADVTLVTEEDYLKLRNRPPLKKSNVVLRGPTGVLQNIGMFQTNISTLTKFNKPKLSYNTYIFVVKNVHDNLLSRTAANRLNLLFHRACNNVNVNTLSLPEEVESFPKLFRGIGEVKCNPVNIQLIDGAIPYSVSTPRRIPIPLFSKVENELKKMEGLGIISKVTEPTEWCAPIVPVVKKNGSVRICVDYKKLNLYVKRERYVLPSTEYITHKLSNAKVFSTLDATCGFYQLPLSDQSKKLTCFISPSGRWCFNRLPQGICLAPEVFMREMKNILKDVEGCEVFMDDIIVFAENVEKHDVCLKHVFQALIEHGVTLNHEKCKFRQKEVKFLGHLITGSGLKPHPDKIAAIVKMPAPTDVAQLRAFLGMVGYLRQYLPNLSHVESPLNDLLKSNSCWCWDSPQEESFIKIKSMLCDETRALAFYDPNRETCVSADASCYGMGGVICQKHGDKWLPVSYCSRTLAPSERRYAQIERELLALTWACRRFNIYLAGLHSFTLCTDHKSLIPIINDKDLDVTPIRCQRMLLTLLKYNVKAKYFPGSQMHIADALSRQPLENDGGSSDDDWESEIHAYVSAVKSTRNFSDHVLEMVKAKSIDELDEVMYYVRKGWPKYIQDVHPSAIAYFQYKDTLSVVDEGLLLYGNRIVIPNGLRAMMLSRIHEGHMGISKCRERARQCLWWPGLSDAINRTVQNCERCQINRNCNQKEKLVTTDLPDRPWMSISADLFQFRGKNYMVIVDYYSRYLEIKKLSRGTDSKNVINKFKSTFSSFGIPLLCFTDNGPQFRSDEFRKFAKDFGFEHRTSSPYHPQGNGEAERAVRTAKKILSSEDESMALLNYRATPTTVTGFSPSQLLMGRNIRTRLPTISSYLEPSWPDSGKVKENDKKAKDRYVKGFKGTKELPALQLGQPV